MSDSSTALAPTSQTTQALARVEVERDVRFIGSLTWLATLPGWATALQGILLGSMSVGALGAALAAVPCIPRWRGRWRLDGILDARERRSPEATVAALRELVRDRWLPAGLRVDAAGWLALGLIEQGELGEAVEALRTSAAASRSWRLRGPALGLFGEGVRALVGRLDPSAGWTVVPSNALLTRQDELANNLLLVVIRAALRLLEAVETGDRGVVAIRWAELPLALEDELPVLTMLLRAEAARIVPSLGVELESRIQALHPVARRLLLERSGALAKDAASGYRALAHVPAPPVADRVLAPLGEARVLKQKSALSQLLRPLAIVALFVHPWAFVGVLGGGLAFAWLTGFPRWERRRERVQLLARLGVPRSTWLREVSHMRTRSHSKRPWAAALGPFDHDHVMLVLAVYKAEWALTTGDRDTAHASIAWWLGNLSPRVVHELDTLALGAALLRLAALLGFEDAVRQLEDLPSSTRGWLRRSGHGDAPRSMAMARAVVAARRGDWSGASEHVTRAIGLPWVDMDEHDHVIYGWLLGRLAERGSELRLTALGLPSYRHPDEAAFGRMLAGG